MKLASLAQPEYLFRPTQMVRRLMCEFRSTPAPYETIRLPWGLPIRIRPDEFIGRRIRRLGIHELPSCEFISRLVEPGDLTVDVGANIGQMTSVMAMNAGPSGKVIAFEPHPMLFDELQHNVSAWRGKPGVAAIDIRNQALSSRKGVGRLIAPPAFDRNHGVSFLAADQPKHPALDGYLDGYEVQVELLDSVITERERIGLLKIDVEGHELEVLQGSGRLLAQGQIRDILFEEKQTPPSPVTELLEKYGYTIHRIDRGILGPILASKAMPPGRTLDQPQDFLATLDSSRVSTRMSKQGWKVYSRDPMKGYPRR